MLSFSLRIGIKWLLQAAKLPIHKSPLLKKDTVSSL
jgi:hypothetical protein